MRTIRLPSNKKLMGASWIFIIGSISVITLWITYIWLSFYWTWDDWGKFGDGFGALTCLFTGLALAGVVASFWHEREQSLARQQEAFDEAMNQFQEQAKVLRVMREQAEASYALAKEMEKTAAINSIVGRINIYTQQIAEHASANSNRRYMDDDIWQRLNRERHSLIEQLDSYRPK